MRADVLIKELEQGEGDLEQLTPLTQREDKPPKEGNLAVECSSDAVAESGVVSCLTSRRGPPVCALVLLVVGLIAHFSGSTSFQERGQQIDSSNILQDAEAQAQPNPPVWPASVQVFGPETPFDTIQAAINGAFALNGGQTPEADNGQFSDARFAFFFKPGAYNVDIPVGYYTQILGLGDTPDAVQFTSSKGVYSARGDADWTMGSLNDFWRSAENFQTSATYEWMSQVPGPYGEVRQQQAVNGMLWAVSQASPLRRIIVTGSLVLSQFDGAQYGRASGGFVANMQIQGDVIVGSQQQFITRNTQVAGWSNGNYNVVFVGVDGAPTNGYCEGPTSRRPYITIDKAPVIAEKPFVTIDAAGKYYLSVPKIKFNVKGIDYDPAGVDKIEFEKVYVAKAETDTAATINAQLSAGLDVVISPGIYNLDAALAPARDNQVILGLGMATLVAAAGNAVISVPSGLHGIRISGLLLQAGPMLSQVLLDWGAAVEPGDENNPGFMHDLFIRVGGPSKDVQTQGMLRIRSGHVVGDNVWLWRADHGAAGYAAVGGSNPSQVGAQILGDDVTMYGLFAEHSLQDQVQWSGQRGSVYLMQMEMPYDVTESFGEAGFTGLRVLDSVTSFQAYGPGLYHYFRDYPVHVRSGIIVPPAIVPYLIAPIAVHLDGKGTVDHVLNDLGPETSPASMNAGAASAYVCPPHAGSAIILSAYPEYNT